MLKAHINLVVSRYKNKIESWDVVNEVINPSDKKPNGLRNSYWYKMLGEQYIDIAFHQAHEADPNAILVYNEWGVEYDTKWSEEKEDMF
ncbi:endo-1,4-beta-xylanase [Acinetobacter soli]|nr:endo-1,4-beta-xylanase [Acinetobacter soli]